MGKSCGYKKLKVRTLRLKHTHQKLGLILPTSAIDKITPHIEC